MKNEALADRVWLWVQMFMEKEL